MRSSIPEINYIGAEIVELTQELLKEWVHYDPETGIFTWKKHRQPYMVGKEIGFFSENYLKTYFSPTKERYYLHRLAWFYSYGKWPDNEIDHINRKPWDNRLNNLRDCPISASNHNRFAYRKNKTGHVGVVQFRVRGAFYARICLQGKQKYLGSFETAEEASAAYQKAKSKLLPA